MAQGLETVANENQLIARLREDVLACDRENLVLFVGHFPLLYSLEGSLAFEGINAWGIFSPYTLKLGCQMGSVARKQGRNVQFVFFADDHTYEPFRNIVETDSNTGEKITVRKQGGVHWANTARHNFYVEKSGSHARLHHIYRSIMAKQGFSEKDVLRQDHGSTRRGDCLYFSEKVLRSSPRDIENACARELVEFFTRYVDVSNSQVMSFIPDRCSSNVCNYVLDKHVRDITATHVFMQTDNTCLGGLTRDRLWEWGVKYRKD